MQPFAVCVSWRICRMMPHAWLLGANCHLLVSILCIQLRPDEVVSVRCTEPLMCDTGLSKPGAGGAGGEVEVLSMLGHLI